MRQVFIMGLVALAALTFTSCKQEPAIAPEDQTENENKPQEEQKLTKVEVSDAEALYVVGFASSKADTKFQKLYKITSQGENKLVAFVDQKGDSMQFAVNSVVSIHNKYVLIGGALIKKRTGKGSATKNVPTDIITENPLKFEPKWLLIRNSDNAVYDLDGRTWGEVQRSKPQIDSEDNLYYVTDLASHDGRLCKMTIPKTGNITVAVVSNDLRPEGSCTVDGNNVVSFIVSSIAGDRQADIYCRFPDGSFVKSETLADRYSFHLFAVKTKGTGGFILVEDKPLRTGGGVVSRWQIGATRITPDIANKKLNCEQLNAIDKKFGIYSIREDFSDGSSILRSKDYKEYILIDANGNITEKSYPTGFPYERQVASNNCVYGTDGSSIYVMNFDTRETKQIFSDNRYRIDSYQVSPKNDYLDIYGLRYTDARKVLLRVDASGQIIKETLQTDNNAEIITFIRLN